MSSDVATQYTIIHPDGREDERLEHMPEDPGYHRLRTVIEPHTGEPMEHVTVLYKGKRADMFVNEMGHLTEPPLPLNPKATAIYRNNWLTQHPGTDPNSLPTIVGVALLFHRIVWR